MTDNRYVKRTIIKEQVPSAILQEIRNVKVYLPPGYNELVSYPVLYCQDGEDFLHFGRTATLMNQLILDDGLEPALVVFVDVDKSARTGEYSPGGGRFRSYLRFFAEELLPFIETKYPVRAEADSRVLAGDSLGGTVSLHLALEYPHLFRRVLALSGAFFSSTRDRIQSIGDLSRLEIYMIVGLQEHDVRTERGTFDFVLENRLTRSALAAQNAKLRYEEKDGTHVWGFWQKELPNALHYFFGDSSHSPSR